MDVLKQLFSAGEFWAAIVGAIVSGVIAIALQLISLREIRRQRSQDLIERQKIHGYSLLLKLLLIHSHAQGLKNQLDEQKMKAKVGQRPWQIYSPFGNFPDSINFSQDELAMLLSIKCDFEFNKILMIDERFNNAIALARLYSESSRKLSNQMPIRMVGKVGHIKISKEAYDDLDYLMTEVDHLVENVIEFLGDNAAEASVGLDVVSKALDVKLGIKLSFSER